LLTIALLKRVNQVDVLLPALSLKSKLNKFVHQTRFTVVEKEVWLHHILCEFIITEPTQDMLSAVVQVIVKVDQVNVVLLLTLNVKVGALRSRFILLVVVQEFEARSMKSTLIVFNQSLHVKTIGIIVAQLAVQVCVAASPVQVIEYVTGSLVFNL
jgi:hypothetical protein